MAEVTMIKLDHDITKRYQWLIGRFKKEFGEENIIYSPLDMGFAFGIGAKNRDKRHAVSVEHCDKNGNLEYSLNDDMNKEIKVQEFIKVIKEKVF